MSRKMLTEAERQERREAARKQARAAVEALQSTAGWQRWLALRRHFHHYSFANQALIASQMPDATRVAGFRAWLKLGYCVRRGEHAIRIWVPMPPTKTQIERWMADGSPSDRRPITHFRLGPVFDRSQVVPLPPPAEPVALDAPIDQVDGDALEWVYPRIVALACEIEVTVGLEQMPRERGGYYQPDGRRIALNDAAPMNQRVKTLLHELGHALLHIEHSDEAATLRYAEEELVVESVAFTVCGTTLGLDTSVYSIPYLASWSEGAELETIERTAHLIDTVAKRIEDAVDVPSAEVSEAA